VPYPRRAWIASAQRKREKGRRQHRLFRVRRCKSQGLGKASSVIGSLCNHSGRPRPDSGVSTAEMGRQTPCLRKERDGVAGAVGHYTTGRQGCPGDSIEFWSCDSTDQRESRWFPAGLARSVSCQRTTCLCRKGEVCGMKAFWSRRREKEVRRPYRCGRAQPLQSFHARAGNNRKGSNPSFTSSLLTGRSCTCALPQPEAGKPPIAMHRHMQSPRRAGCSHDVPVFTPPVGHPLSSQPLMRPDYPFHRSISFLIGFWAQWE
jgi:hypothetical protein